MHAMRKKMIPETVHSHIFILLTTPSQPNLSHGTHHTHTTAPKKIKPPPFPNHFPPMRILFLLIKLQTHAIDTMPLIRRGRVPFPLEHMAQMAAALGANDLRPGHAEGAIRMPRHGAGDAVEVGGPAAAALELVAGLVQRRVAGQAVVRARGRHVLVVLAREGRLRALLADHPELLRREDGLPLGGRARVRVVGPLVGHVVVVVGGGAGGEESGEEWEGGPGADDGEGVVGGWGELGKGFGDGLVGEDQGAG